MYHRIKNTLAGLGMAAAFLIVGTLLSDPVPAAAAPRVLAPELQEVRIDSDSAAALALVRVVLRLADHQTALAARQNEPAHETGDTRSRGDRAARLKRELGMPYYSFGAMLSRHGES